MARWKVTSKHYIHAKQFGEDTTWVREETNRETGRNFRRTFAVPLFVDPEDPICINRIEGFCVVATEGSEKPGDIILLGEPTPDMEPLDEEAREITARESPKWKNPIDSLPITIGEDFGQKLLSALTSQMNSVPNTSLAGVKSGELDELRAMIAEQQKQIQALLGSGSGLAASEDIDLNAPPTKVEVPTPTARRA